jgi:hypothetical protein
MKLRKIVPVALIAVGAILLGGVAFGYSQSEQTRECTIESVDSSSRYRDRTQLYLHTAECGVIAFRGELPIRVVDPDCYWNNFTIGGRYEMTTVGFEGFVLYRPLQQHLVGPLVLVESPPGAVCSSDSWYVED